MPAREFCFCAITNERAGRARYLILIDICGKVIDTWTYRNQPRAPRFPTDICTAASEQTSAAHAAKIRPPSAQKGLPQCNSKGLMPFERRFRRYSCVCSATLYLCESIFHTPCDTNRCTQRKAQKMLPHSVSMNRTRRRSIYELITHTDIGIHE